MAHNSTLWAYANAAYHLHQLKRQLAAAQTELARLEPQVLTHIQRTQPVTCALANSVLVTIELDPQHRRGGSYLHTVISQAVSD